MRVPNRQLPLCKSPCCEEVKDLSKRDPNIIQMWDPLKKAMEDVRIAGTVSISDTFSKLRFFINRLFTLVSLVHIVLAAQLLLPQEDWAQCMDHGGA